MKPSHALLALFVATGCGVQDTTDSADPRGEAGEALRLSKLKFVTAERDLKKCLHGNCGGWYLTDANDPAAVPVYVQTLTFLTKELAANADQLERAEAGDLVLQGRATGRLTAGFEVVAAWRALPGGSVQKGDRLFTLQGSNGCNGLWCRPASVVALNDTQVTYVEGFGLELQQNVHQPWVDDRIAQGRGLALGNFAKGTGLDAFTARRVFLQLPERSNCPQIKPPACGTGATKDPVKVATFGLDADRCLFFAQCEEPTACPVYVVAPSCAPGYVAREFTASPGACTQLTCDVAWAE